MSLVSPEFADVKDPPDKASKSTVLIAAVQEDEPVVNMEELWSYYRVSPPREFCTLRLPSHSLLQRRQRKPSFHLVSFFTFIPSHSVGPLGYTQTPLLPLATIRLLCQARPVFQVLPRDNASSLAWVVPNPPRASPPLRMAHQLCGHDSHIHHNRFRRRL